MDAGAYNNFSTADAGVFSHFPTADVEAYNNCPPTPGRSMAMDANNSPEYTYGMNFFAGPSTATDASAIPRAMNTDYPMQSGDFDMMGMAQCPQFGMPHMSHMHQMPLPTSPHNPHMNNYQGCQSSFPAGYSGPPQTPYSFAAVGSPDFRQPSANLNFAQPANMSIEQQQAMVSPGFQQPLTNMNFVQPVNMSIEQQAMASPGFQQPSANMNFFQPVNTNIEQQASYPGAASTNKSRSKPQVMDCDFMPKSPRVRKPVSPITSSNQTVLNNALAAAFQEGVIQCRYLILSKLCGELLRSRSIFNVSLATFGADIVPRLSKYMTLWMDTNGRFAELSEPFEIANEIRSEYEKKSPHVFVPSYPEVKGRPASPPITDDDEASSGNGGGDKTKDSFTLTGESKIRNFEGQSSVSYMCSDKQYRLLENEELKRAEDRTVASYLAHNISSRITPMLQPKASDYKRKVTPAGAPGRAAKKRKISKEPTRQTPRAQSQQLASEGNTSASIVVPAGPNLTPSGRANNSKNAPTRTRFMARNPLTGTLVPPVPSSSMGMSQAQQPSGAVAKEVIDSAAIDDAPGTIDLTNTEAAVDVAQGEGPPQSDKNYVEKRLHEWVNLDKSHPSSVMYAYLSPKMDSEYPRVRAAAENNEGDISDLLFNEDHRREALEEYSRIRNKKFQVKSDDRPEWDSSVRHAEKRALKKSRLNEEQKAAREKREKAAEKQALEEQQTNEQLVTLAAHTYVQEENPQVQDEAAPLQAETDSLFGHGSQSKDVVVEGSVAPMKTETSPLSGESQEVELVVGDSLAPMEAETSPLSGESQEVELVVGDSLAPMEAETSPLSGESQEVEPVVDGSAAPMQNENSMPSEERMMDATSFDDPSSFAISELNSGILPADWDLSVEEGWGYGTPMPTTDLDAAMDKLLCPDES